MKKKLAMLVVALVALVSLGGCIFVDDDCGGGRTRSSYSRGGHCR